MYTAPHTAKSCESQLYTDLNSVGLIGDLKWRDIRKLVDGDVCVSSFHYEQLYHINGRTLN